ncbi:hypothetical protein [Actinocatenispora rupis]|uniref:hypothetical protein n=1 Tax=Actinocatenispora rupis TaxID=519421 RepID=UPI00194316D9|nr:hypothetical protein [Actinocatenispora rupis]
MDDLTLLGGGRILPENIRPLLELLAMYAGSGSDPDEWEAVESGLVGTDDAATTGWYVHALQGGAARLVVVLARVSDEDVVAVRVWGDEQAGLGERIDTLFDVGAMYRMTPP